MTTYDDSLTIEQVTLTKTAPPGECDDPSDKIVTVYW